MASKQVAMLQVSCGREMVSLSLKIEVTRTISTLGPFAGLR